MVFEQVGDGVADNMYAQGGHDNLRAQNYTNDNDTANGGTGHDVLHVNDGDALDGAVGGPGFDTCVVDATIERPIPVSRWSFARECKKKNERTRRSALGGG